MSLDVIECRVRAGDLPAALAASLSDWVSKERKLEENRAGSFALEHLLSRC